jgi:hypothetical protein
MPGYEIRLPITTHHHPIVREGPQRRLEDSRQAKVRDLDTASFICPSVVTIYEDI